MDDEEDILDGVISKHPVYKKLDAIINSLANQYQHLGNLKSFD